MADDERDADAPGAPTGDDGSRFDTRGFDDGPGPDDATGLGSRRSIVHRWIGLLGLSLRRVFASIRRPGTSRVTVAVLVVAVAVAVLIVVTGVSLGLANQPTVDDGTEYWIAPETAGTLTTLTAADGPQLGDVHTTSAELEALDEVDRATPILIEVLELRTDFDQGGEYILAIGVVVPEDGTPVAGVSTDVMTPGDPYFGDGHYDGEYTGEVVLSPAAAEMLDAEGDESLLITRPGPGAVDQSFFVAGVSEEDARTVQGEAPVALFQLSELQEFTGAATGDQADQILVHADSEAAVPILEEAYSEATVVERGALNGDRLMDADLPLAVSFSALLVVLVVMTLVVATTAGIDVEADRRQLAVFAALGVSARSTAGLVAARALALALLGGVVGATLGGAGLLALNHVVAPYYDLAAFALVSPTLLAYGAGVALLAGLLAVPYPVVLARRTATLRELGG